MSHFRFHFPRGNGTNLLMENPESGEGEGNGRKTIYDQAVGSPAASSNAGRVARISDRGSISVSRSPEPGCQR